MSTFSKKICCRFFGADSNTNTFFRTNAEKTFLFRRWWPSTARAQPHGCNFLLSLRAQRAAAKIWRARARSPISDEWLAARRVNASVNCSPRRLSVDRSPRLFDIAMSAKSSAQRTRRIFRASVFDRAFSLVGARAMIAPVWSSSLLLACAALPQLGDEQSIAAKGRLVCKNEPAADVVSGV